MIRVTVAFPQEEGKTFNWDYFLNNHGPLVHENLSTRGLVSIEVDRGISAPDPSAPPPFVAMAHLNFNTVDEVHEAFKEVGRAVVGDIANFTDISPTIQISETLG